MELVEECVVHVDAGESLSIGNSPIGMRTIVPVTGGWVRGARLNGTVVGPGADWAVVGTDGYVRLDVRIQLQTDDGALVYVEYPGLLELNEASLGALAGGSSDYDDHYFRTTPRFETGDDRYGWLNTSVFVGRGRLAAGVVEYEIYRVT